MPFFIKHAPKTLWDVYLVEAASAEAVLNWEYDEERGQQLLGDFITDSVQDNDIFGPFTSREEALKSPEAWVERDDPEPWVERDE